MGTKKERKEKKDIKDRLLLYLKSIGLSINRLERIAGLTNRYLNNVHFQVPMDKVQMILDVLPDLNRVWLLEGKGEMCNNPLRTSGGLENRKEVLRRLERVIQSKGFKDLGEYEEDSLLRPGTIAYNITQGEDRLVSNTVFSVLSYSTDFSIDWVLYGHGTMRIGAMISVPVVYVEDILREGKYPPPTGTDMLVPAPSFVIPGWTDEGKVFNGFLFIVPEMSSFKRSRDNGITDDDVRPPFANSTTIRLYPDDAILCERCGNELEKGIPYLFYSPALQIVACALYEESGFRFDEPASDYFGSRYYYYQVDEVVVLGKVCRKMTSRLDA